jgi:hypothetical protein
MNKPYKLFLRKIFTVIIVAIPLIVKPQNLCSRYINIYEEPDRQVTFNLPIELGDGFLWGRDKTLYTFSMRMHPSWELIKDFQIGPSLGMYYSNPQVEWLAGLRLLYKLMSFDLITYVPLGSLNIFGEIYYGTHSTTMLSGGISFALSKALQMGVRPSVELPFSSGKGGLEAFIGFDPTIMYSEERSRITIAESITEQSPRDYYSSITTEAKNQLFVLLAQDSSLIKIREAFNNFDFNGTTIASLKNYLSQQELPELEHQVDSVKNDAERIAIVSDIPVPEIINEQLFINALFKGWCKAITWKE